MPPFFFEKQVELNCAVHSINNYFQEEIIPCDDLNLLRNWIRENYAADKEGTYDIHFRDNGFFSVPTLLHYVSHSFGLNIPTMLGSRPPMTETQALAILRDNTRIISSRSNKPYKHSVAAIKKGDYWYLLDSENSSPSRRLSEVKLLNRLTGIIYAEIRPNELPSDTSEVIVIDSKMSISSLHSFVR